MHIFSLQVGSNGLYSSVEAEMAACIEVICRLDGWI
jgi:hypothetical protein